MQSYLSLLTDVMESGESHADRTGVGTRSVFGRQWRHDMREGFPLLTTKRLPLRWIFEELRWFLSGSTDVKDLQAAKVDIWDEWATPERCAKFNRLPGDLGPIYGALWRSFPIGVRWGRASLGTTDQIGSIMTELDVNPGSRRIIVSGWHPHYQKRVALPPCHTLWQLKVHEDDSISLHLYARSIDIFLGLPFNIASYGMLLSMIGIVTGREARDLIISFGDLHLYNNHVTQAIEQLSRTPYPLPGVSIAHKLDGKPRTSLEKLLGIEWKDVELLSYRHHPKIDAEVAV